MENQTAPNNPHADLIDTFTQITSSSPQEAIFFLESHNFDLDAAVSTFFETSTAAADADAAIPVAAERSESLSPDSTPSRSRSPSPQPPLRPQSDRVYNLRSRRQGSDKKASGSRGGRIHTFSDLNKKDEDDSDSDEQPQEYFTGGEKSGMLVQDPSKGNDVDALFDQARQAGGVEGHGDHLQPSSSSRSFSGTARLLTGETIATAPSHPETVTHTITFWTNGFTIDDGPLRRMDDPENASFLESIRKSECPQELAPADVRTVVHVNLMRKEQECPVPKKRPNSFQGQGRTLGSNNDAVPAETTTPSNLQSAPPPSMGLVVDQALPSTSIQLRLADGTRMVSRFNFHHTVRDIRGFIDASRPAAPRSYHLQTVGFPPKQLTNLEQTIEEAGLANSVVIQKL